MSDTDIKILIVIVGLISSFISIVVSGIANSFLFFWFEGRKRYQSRLSSLRMLLIIIESIEISANTDMQSSEIKLDWFISHSDSLYYNKESVSIVKEIIEANAEFGKIISQVVNSQNSETRKEADFTPLLLKLNPMKQRVNNLLKIELKSCKRKLYLVSKSGE